MHVPDNYLSPQTDAVAAVAMVGVWAHCAKVVRKQLDQKHLAFLGVAAAFSFLLMMFNVPLPGGTTGHAVGGTLVAVMLGPEAACIAVSVALAVQAVVFGDGGILAFGVNCFNMAFVLPFVGYGIYRLISTRIPGEAGRRVGMAVGSYVGINVAALCAAIEFGIQPALFHDASGAALYCPYPLSVSIPAMMIPHLLVAGVVEAVSTVAIYSFVKSAAPEYLLAEDGSGEPRRSSLVPVAVPMAALVVLTPLGLLAEGDAWGEWDAETLGELAGSVPAGIADGFSFDALMPDYSLAGLPDAVGYVLSAVVGVALLVIVFKLLSGLGKGQAQDGATARA